MEVVKLGVYLTIGIIGVFIVFGFLIDWLNKFSRKKLYRAFGVPALYVTSAIGTPVHEFGHYIMCKLFFHRVVRVKWFIPSAVENGGVLGYVEHSRDKNNIYQRVGDFFIGMGPLFVGSILIILGCKYLLPDTFSTIFNMSELNIIEILKAIFSSSNLVSYKFWIFIVLAICISSHMSLSKADVKNSYYGAIVLFIINILIAYLFISYKLDTAKLISFIITYNYIFISLLSIGVISILITIAVSTTILALKR